MQERLDVIELMKKANMSYCGVYHRYENGKAKTFRNILVFKCDVSLPTELEIHVVIEANMQYVLRDLWGNGVHAKTAEDVVIEAVNFKIKHLEHHHYMTLEGLKILQKHMQEEKEKTNAKN